MSHLSDKELDRLSRVAAEQFDVEGSPSGWDALEKELDKAIPVDGPKPGSRRRGFGYWGGGAALLILITAALFYFTGPSKNTGNTELTSSSKNSDPTISKLQELPGNTVSKDRINNNPGDAGKDRNSAGSGPGTGSESINDNESATASGLAINKKNDQLTKGQDLNASTGNPLAQGSKKGSSTRPRESSSNDDRYTSSSHGGNRTTSSKDERYSPGNDLNNRSSPSGEKVNSSALPESTGSESDLYQPILPSIDHKAHRFFIPDSTNIDSLMKDLAARSPERDTTIKRTTVFPFEVGMVLGADKSNVNFNGGYKTGFNYGIYAGYRISKRWSVNTGLVFNKKYYIAQGKDFHPPKGYWTDYVKLDKVSGNCTMWEIPLNLRYDLSITRKGYWFASAGLSTYLMQNENYDYYYWQNGNYYTRHRGYPSDEKAILGILNLSAGFEKNFTPHLSLQIEPYMRIPLKGVGFGQMQMNSFGTNVILKFKSGKARNY